MNKEIYLRKFKNYLLSEGRSKETIKSYIRSVEQFIEITKKKDPFKDAKRKSTIATLRIYGSLKKKVATAHDPLLMAVELAIQKLS